MELLKKLDWKQVVAVLVAMGVLSTADQDTAILSVFAVLIAAVVNLGAKYFDVKLGRGWISLLVYGVAFGLAVFGQPPSISLPVWSGDPAAVTTNLAALIEAVGAYALVVTGSATILYNALAKLVFDKIDDLMPKG